MAYTTIDDPSAHFQTALYTGNGSANHAITNDGNSDLQPDLVWIKNRDAADSHCLFDSTRGATEVLHCDDNAAEATDADTLDSFASDGFQVDADDKVNTNTEAYVAWQWKANGGSRTTNAEDGNNPAGGYQANTTAGFSIVDYTGTGAAGTMAHGLGAAPEFLIIKGRERADAWRMGSDFLTSWAYNMLPNLSYAEYSATAIFNSTAPTSSVFSIGSDGATNADGEGHIAYLFKSIQGFSKSGKYTGNGNADGTFVYTGFKPALLITKRSDAVSDWRIWDFKRDPENVVDRILYPSANNAEGSETFGDFLSNGFKVRVSTTDYNASGGTYIYMAFAESPFVTSGGVPCTAK